MTASIWWVEEAFSVPVVMNFADTPFDIAEVALIAENNPFPMVARIYPQRPVTAIGFNIRLEMSTPVRAAVMDGDGVWHVVSKEVLVMTPGGCSAPGGSGVAAAGETAGDILLGDDARDLAVLSENDDTRRVRLAEQAQHIDTARAPRCRPARRAYGRAPSG